MLAIPEHGINRSVTKHNSDLGIACDWLESSILFSSDQVSKTDVIDALLEEEIYDSQDFAREFVENIWSVIKYRQSILIDSFTFEYTGDRIIRNADWQDFPAYAFCLAVSCGSYLYPKWAVDFGHDPIGQGSLFERIAHASLKGMLPGWSIRRVGWAPDNPTKLKDVINEIIQELNEVAGSEIDQYVDDHANELGLDLLASYSFGDDNSSAPILMIQCASGKDWKQKRHTPDLNIWNKVINFNSSPTKGFAIPYSFADISDFRVAATAVCGMFMDRYRILNPNKGSGNVWNEASLNQDLVDWTQPRVAALPRINV